MSEYVIQPKSIDVYNVHKFDDGADVPNTTYIVVWGKRPRCNCPSGTYRGYCKHVDYVRKYRKVIALGEVNPMVAFND